MCAERPVSILFPSRRRQFCTNTAGLVLQAVLLIRFLVLNPPLNPSCVPFLLHTNLDQAKTARYLLRAEIIALHAASSYPGAQLYMECAQIAVTGGGSGNPATVSFPGAYKGTDPGIKFQLYWPVPTSYAIPGPRPFVC
jgi:hypothetical protein